MGWISPQEQLFLRSGSQRHRHFAGFFNVPVIHRHGTTLFIRWFRHTAPFSRLLRSRWGYGGHILDLTPGPSRGGGGHRVALLMNIWRHWVWWQNNFVGCFARIMLQRQRESQKMLSIYGRVSSGFKITKWNISEKYHRWLQFYVKIRHPKEMGLCHTSHPN